MGLSLADLKGNTDGRQSGVLVVNIGTPTYFLRRTLRSSEPATAPCYNLKLLRKKVPAEPSKKPLSAEPRTSIEQGTNGQKTVDKKTWSKIDNRQKEKVYNKIGNHTSEWGVAISNIRGGASTHNKKIYEVVAEAEEDRIGAWAIVEHGEHWDVEKTGEETRTSELGGGWQWSRASATRDGPKGTAIIGGVGLLISPKFGAAYAGCKVLSPRAMAFTFKAENQQNIHILVVYSPPAVPTNKAAIKAHNELILGFTSAIPAGELVIVTGDFNATLQTDDPLSPEERTKIQRRMRRVLYSLPEEPQNSSAGELRKLIEDADLFPLNARFRQKNNNSYYTFTGPNNRRARLDYIMVRGKWAFGIRSVTVRPLRNISSDHKVVIARGKWRLQAKPKPAAPIVKLDYKVLTRGDNAVNYQQQFMDSFGQAFKCYDPSLSLDENFDNMVNAVKVSEKAAAIPAMTRMQRRRPWEEQPVVTLRAERAAARAHFKRNRSPGNKQRLKDVSCRLKEAYKQAEDEYIARRCEELNKLQSENRTDLVYQITRTVIAGDTAAARLAAWHAHFQTAVYSKTTVDDGSEVTLESVFGPDTQSEFDTGRITLYEVKRMIATTQGGKACGEDGIPVEILKIPGFAEYCVDLLNRCLDSGTVPLRWKTLIIVPVPKKGDLSLPKNYRGISLMDILAKMYNKILLNRVRPVLDRKLVYCQNGFRPGRSTVSQIIALRELLRYCRSDRDQTLVMVFIDFNKAFDSVSWRYLRAILLRLAYGVPLKLVTAIMSLYVGTTARVRTADGPTDPITLEQGVLQGDTLAPYLFIIVMDYIMRKWHNSRPNPVIPAGFQLPAVPVRSGVQTRSTRASSSETLVELATPVGRQTRSRSAKTRKLSQQDRSLEAEPSQTQNLSGQTLEMREANELLQWMLALLLVFAILAFADDAAICEGGRMTLKQALASILIMLHRFEIFSNEVGLTINDDKTVGLVCHRGKIMRPTKGLLSLVSGKPIHSVANFKYLSGLLPDDHSDVGSRLFAGWAATRKAVKIWQSPTLSTRSKTTFFKTLCQSVFLYGSESWVIDTDLNDTLRGAYTRMLRFAKGLDWASHPTIAQIYEDSPSVIALITERRLNHLGRTIKRRFTYPGWDAVVAASVATVPPPAPILNPALVQARKRSASARNLKKHDGRTPIRSLRKLRANCARLSSSPEQQTKPRKHQSTPLPLNSPAAGQHGGDHLGSLIGSPIASRGADILQATPQNTNK